MSCGCEYLIHDEYNGDWDCDIVLPIDCGECPYGSLFVGAPSRESAEESLRVILRKMDEEDRKFLIDMLRHDMIMTKTHRWHIDEEWWKLFREHQKEKVNEGLSGVLQA